MMEGANILEDILQGERAMIEDRFNELYTKIKLRFFAKVFGQLENEKRNLSAIEIFCVEVISLLNRPTVNEFATFAQISQPNAAYKINNLIKKGYVRKVRNEQDKREFHLEVTEKYSDFSGVTADYIKVVMDRARARFAKEDIDKVEEIFKIVAEDLMPEVPGKE